MGAVCLGLVIGSPCEGLSTVLVVREHIWLLPFFVGGKCKSLFLQARACEVDGSSLMVGRPPSGSGDCSVHSPPPRSSNWRRRQIGGRSATCSRMRPSSEVCRRCCRPCPAAPMKSARPRGLRISIRRCAMLERDLPSPFPLGRLVLQVSA